MAHVSKRKDRDGGAVWWIDYYFEGRRYRQKIGSMKKAGEALAQIRVKIATGEFVTPEELRAQKKVRKAQEALEPKAVLFADFAKDEYLPWSELNHSAKHFTHQKSIVGSQLVPFFKGHHLHEITPRLLEEYVSRRRRQIVNRKGERRRVREATANRDIACLKVMFRLAVEWGRLEDSPATGLKVLKEIPNPPRLLEPAEVIRLLDAMPDHLRALVGCAVYAGLRREELFHLRWEDIDTRAGHVAAVSRREHHTKNYKTRQIPLCEPLKELLLRHPRRLGSPYVFANRNGRPYDNIDCSLARAAQVAGIDDLSMHQLRHAFCSHALMRGIDPRTVQKWMGHSDLTTTLRYAHVSPDHERAAIQRLRYDTGHQVDTNAQTA